MFPPIIYTKGQQLRVAYNGQTVRAQVELASANGRSLFLTFDGVLVTPSEGVFVGKLAVLWENGTFADILEGGPCELSPWGDA